MAVRVMSYVAALYQDLIDQGAYAPEDLEKREGLTALLFWLKSQGARGPRRVHSRLKKLLAQADDPDLYRAVLVWLSVEAKQDPGRIPEILTLEEFSDMWAKTFEKFEREVREEGRKEGETDLLLRQLERKFGPLDARTRARIRRAGPDRLLEWGERFVTAERLEEVFEG